MPSGSIRLNQNAVTARIVWPVAFILMALLGLVTLLLSWNGHRANQAALDRQRIELADKLDAERSQVLLRLRRAADSPGILDALERAPADLAAIDRITAALLAGQAFDQIFVLGANGQVIAGAALAGRADQARFERERPDYAPVLRAVGERAGQGALRPSDAGAGPAPEGPSAPEGDARLIQGLAGPRIVAAMALPERGAEPSVFGGRLLVASRPLTPSALEDLGLTRRFADLRVQTSSAVPASSLALRKADGPTGAWFTWRAEEPGTVLLTLLVPSVTVAFCAILLFCAFLFAHVRTITVDLMAREAEATHQSLHDDLSGLPNRAFFTERLDAELAALRPGGDEVAVFYLDLDRFKEINDVHGHDTGDELIMVVARRLSAALRGTDTLARFGGDEFAVIQTGVKSPHDCATLAHRLLDAMRSAFDIDGRQIYVGVSIGIAMAPQNGHDRATIMKLADVALYRAKHEGRNRYAFFEIGMDSTLRLRKLVEEDLRDTIAQDRLDIAYQPQFSADGSKITGVEALVRWNHPVHGWISPGDFVPIAEERGLVSMLGEWVLRRACRDGRRWPDISVAVNVSPIQFRHKDFVQTIMRIVAEEKMDPSRIELELTEGVIVEDADAAENAMMELRAEGFRFALDDFGTGYSSLIYLRRFAFDKIKIDRSFLESMETTGESAILVHSVVHLGRALGLTVTAEGVETTEQQRFLQAVGCHQLQGYLLSKPVPAAAIDAMLGLVPEATAEVA